MTMTTATTPATEQQQSAITPQDYKDAILSQTACNLSGIVFGFAETMKHICEEANRTGQGTDWKNHHAICRLYAEQISFLAGSDMDSWKAAIEQAEKGAAQ